MPRYFSGMALSRVSRISTRTGFTSLGPDNAKLLHGKLGNNPLISSIVSYLMRRSKSERFAPLILPQLDLLKVSFNANPADYLWQANNQRGTCANVGEGF